AGGALSLAAYWIAIWAMTVAPIAMVAALRETSVLFAAAIAVVILKEPLRAARVIAAITIVIGMVLIRLRERSTRPRSCPPRPAATRPRAGGCRATRRRPRGSGRRPRSDAR